AGDAAARRRLTAKLERDPRVVEVVPEHRATPRGVPDDTAVHEQDPLSPPGITKAWWALQMRLPQAWSLASGSGVKVAVIDTGFDLSHPQLAGIVDTATTAVTQGVPGTARTDEYGHGTHVASLACSAFDDAAGTVGAGGRCRLITIKSDLYDTSVAKGIDKAVDLGADAVVMSFGVDGVAEAPRIIREAVERAQRAGVVLVAAAADSPTGEQGYPANVLQPTGTGRSRTKGLGLSVTAATADGSRAAFAGYGSQISVAGYGTYSNAGGPPGIVGAFPGNAAAFEVANGGGQAPATRTTVGGDRRYAYEAGTSMATPMVAGVAALVRDVNPDLDATRIARVIKESATAGSWNEQTGWGPVDGLEAVEDARRIDLRAPTARFSTRSRRATSARQALRWTATDPAPGRLVASGVRTVEVWRSVDGGRFRRMGSGKRGRLTVSVPRGTVRFALRGVDEAGNRAKVPTKGTLTLTRR
ncbi:S8 family peptidase, partial [Patulibacter sp. S7RM1-6]